MGNRDFENGRKLERLISQIGQIEIELLPGGGFYGSISSVDFGKKMLTEAFTEYISIASKYGLDREIFKIRDKYDEIMGREKSEPALRSASACPF